MVISMSATATIAELCQVEGDDGLHEFGGGHGNKGNDFARFWLISELLALTEVGANDYLFILEYVQDVALVDNPSAPAAITLYQLKKKEGSVWDLNSLAGLTDKGKQVKATSPLAKMVKAVLGFKTLSASAEFVSNTRFNVKLAAGGTALQMDYLSLADLTIERAVSSQKCNTRVNELKMMVCENWPGSARTSPVGCASCG